MTFGTLNPPPSANECPGCGYSLIGNVAGRCPECGDTFTAEELARSLPWERPKRYGLVGGFVRTVVRALLHPRAFFAAFQQRAHVPVRRAALFVGVSLVLLVIAGAAIGLLGRTIGFAAASGALRWGIWREIRETLRSAFAHDLVDYFYRAFEFTVATLFASLTLWWCRTPSTRQRLRYKDCLFLGSLFLLPVPVLEAFAAACILTADTMKMSRPTALLDMAYYSGIAGYALGFAFIGVMRGLPLRRVLIASMGLAGLIWYLKVCVRALVDWWFFPWL